MQGSVSGSLAAVSAELIAVRDVVVQDVPDVVLQIAPRMEAGGVQRRRYYTRNVATQSAVMLDPDVKTPHAAGALNEPRNIGDAQHLSSDVGHAKLNRHIAEAKKPVDGVIDVDEAVQGIYARPSD
jgi:hypothetical protein